MAQVIGDELNNVLVGTAEADTISGFGGNDTISGLGGADSIDGGEGFDRASYQNDAGLGGAAGVIINLSATSQTSNGFTVAAGTARDGFGTVDTLLDIEAVSGTAGADVFFSGTGSGAAGTASNTFFGLGGDDAVFGSGGQNADTVDYSLDVEFGATHGIRVNMRAQTVQESIQPDTVLGSFGDTDFIPGIRNITGTLFRDEIYGGNNANVLNTGAGDDLVFGGDGNDTIIAGDGNDTIIGGAGADAIDGGAGADELDYGAEGGPQGVRVNLNGLDFQIGLPPDTAIDSFGDTDTVTRIPNVTGTSLVDEIYGGNHDNVLRGGAGNDVLLGGAANDTLDGGADDDMVRYYGNRADYRISQNPDGSFTVVDLVTDISPPASPDTPATIRDEGTDRVLNVEQFRFADQTIAAAQILIDAPSITSDGGGGTAAITIAENGTIVTTVTASDPQAGDTLTYTIAGGVDGSRFAINSLTGLLSFLQAPDFETPTDTGGDNVYDVTVAVSDGNGGADTQDIAVTVANVVGNSPGASNAATITGTSEDDILTGLGGANALLGLAGNDILNGGGGSDTLDGGVGADTMAGGTGNDSYVVDNAADSVIENIGAGTDTVRTALAAYSLAGLANVENLSFTGAGAFSGTGNGLANVIMGGSGNDILDGGAGNDRMLGGLGDDIYHVDSPSDLVIEQAGAGSDLVLATAGVFALGANVENLTFVGVGNFTGTGNGSDNVITGGAGDDTLDGRGGDDVIIAGSGTDTLLGGGGADQLDGGAGADLLDGGGGADVLIGGHDADTLLGGGGADLLDGGLGGDRMEGGAGSDTYIVDDVLDVVIENAGAGRDEVRTDLQTYVLAGNVENLSFVGFGPFTGSGNGLNNSLTGGAAGDVLASGGGNDRLSGLGGNDTVSGEAGADILDGGAGADVLIGGTGNDTFIFSQNFGHDTISDFGDVGGNNDRIQFSTATFANFGAVAAASQQIGADVVITVDENNSVILANIAIGTLGSSDFFFI
ncbi:cadherin domain-containing protein [Bosea sp. BIWAKO-01]|uniref:beta strand repeat-containing protein n=1 Tax=Bosea sp. BIWAKO-01 TaxID=506668 RepID=UPI000852C443|nr:cadherin domain-containing protein [Bosea sp. BIWAKO-01]GAU85718.1 alkaline phosphatase [Bosea sp. BIWAKO-01]